MVLAFWLCLDAFHRNARTLGRGSFIGVAAATSAWCIGSIAELHGRVGALGGDRIGCAGAVTLPVSPKRSSAGVLVLVVPRFKNGATRDP